MLRSAPLFAAWCAADPGPINFRGVLSRAYAAASKSGLSFQVLLRELIFFAV
jgi:hypothetical protein